MTTHLKIFSTVDLPIIQTTFNPVYLSRVGVWSPYKMGGLVTEF